MSVAPGVLVAVVTESAVGTAPREWMAVALYIGGRRQRVPLPTGEGSR